MSRHDCGSHYWKEKCISGLPTSTLKIEKTQSEINEVQKIENKEKIKIIKTINVISSKVDKQVFFFYVIDKIKAEETQKIIYKT